MNIFITGGNGFAGRYLSEYFVKKGHDVTATFRGNSLRNKVAGVKYIRQELSENICINKSFDHIIHTACSHSGEELSMEEYVRDNIEPARKLIRFARDNRIKSIVYFSTRNIYGQIKSLEVNEEEDIINPDKYGLTKRIAELIFREADDINTIGLRLPGIIGPGAHDIWLVNLFDKIMHGTEVVVSDFDTRNLVHIDDISKFIEKLITTTYKDGRFKYPVVNLACRETINNIKIANLIKDILKSNSNIIVKEADSGLFRLNPDKALEMGFEPSTPWEIINKYVDFMCDSEMHNG